MNGNKFIKALSSLDKQEWISYRKYLLMNTSDTSDNYRIFAYLQKRKEKLADIAELEEIRHKYFKDLSTKSILNILSRLYLWLEEWLVYYSIKNDKMESDLILVKQLNRRGLYNLADQKTKQLQKQISEDDGLSLKNSRVQSELYYYQFYSDNPIKLDDHYNLFEKLYNSTKQYHQEKEVLLETELYNRQKLYSLDYSYLLTADHKSQLYDSIKLLSTTVQTYELAPFEQIKTKLFAGEFKTGSDIHIVITLYLQNLISRFYNLTSKVNHNDISQLYSYAIESGVLLSNGKLPVLRFNNLINSIAQTHTIEETNIFINQWISIVDSPNLDAVKDLADARNQYFHQNYAGISNAILFHNYTDPGQRIISLGFVLISLYEDQTVDYDIAISYCNNMKRTLKRNKEKFSPSIFKSILNFIRVIELLNKTRNDFVNININDYHPVYFKSWVIQKIK